MRRGYDLFCREIVPILDRLRYVWTNIMEKEVEMPHWALEILRQLFRGSVAYYSKFLPVMK